MTQSPQHDPRDTGALDAARATDEHNGYGTASGGGNGTPPAEGVGVGPTNHEMDVEKAGERSGPKLILIALAVLVALGILLFILGRIASIGG